MRMRAANLLVGNDEGAAGLEAVFMGPKLEFHDDALVAVTGADMPVKIDGVAPARLDGPQGQGRVRSVSFDFLKSGARICIAVSGGIDVPDALGSRSTYPIGALGGYKGRAIAVGDELPVGQGSLASEGKSVAEELRRKPAERPPNCGCCRGSTGTG